METSFNQISSTYGRLRVTVDEADYKPAIDKKIKEYSKTAQVKGFRPGMVPKEYIQRVYGKSIKVDEVINTISKITNEAIAEKKLRVVGDLMPDNEVSKDINWNTDKTFTFEYEVGMASDFSVDLAALPAINTYEIEPTEDRIKEAIADLCKRYGKDAEVEEVELEDMVFGSLVQVSPAEGEEAKTLEAVIPTNRIKADSFHIFKGLEKDSKVNFDIQSIFENVRDLGFAMAISEEEAQELAGEYSLTVTKITRVTPAEIGQELFDKALGEGKVTNEEDFNTEIKKIIAENYQRESSFMADFEIDKTLNESISIELPDDFLKRWLLQINEGKFTEEQIEKDYAAFARGLRLDLIRNEIAQNNEIKLEYNDVLEEVKNEMRNYFGAYSYEGIEELIDKMARNQLKENKDGVVRKYTDMAFAKKVREFLKTQLTFASKKVNVDEFNKIAEEIYALPA